MNLDNLKEDKKMLGGISVIIILIILLAGIVLYTTMQPEEEPKEQKPIQEDNKTTPDQNRTKDDYDADAGEADNPIDETNTTGEVVQNYTDDREPKDTTTTGDDSFTIKLETPPIRGGSTDILFKVNGEPISGASVYVDGEMQRETQSGLAAGRTFINVPDKEYFTIRIEHEGEEYTRSVKTE